MKSSADPTPTIAVLLVEDEKVALQLLSMILARKFPAIALYTASNGRTGLDLFKTHMPEIVITDINMPEMGGVQLTDEIRAIKPDTKFIVLTGDPEILVNRDSVENRLPFDHYIGKPVSFEDLFAAVEQCLDEIAHASVIVR